MKKKSIKSLLVNQTRRRKIVLAYVCAIVLVFIISLLLLSWYLKRSEAQYIRYAENGNIDYKVLYKENDYFDKSYLNSNRQYIASIIDNIKASFNYRIAFDDSSIEYKYSYRIEANVTVKDKKNSNLFYEKTDVLLRKKETVSSNDEISIQEDIVIDYEKYNKVIEKFVNIYDLNNASSTLNINMYVNVVGTSEEFVDNPKKDRVISLQIPLTEDTIAIDFVDDIVNESNNVIKCVSSNEGNAVILMIAIVFTVVGVILIFLMIRFEIKTRSAETIYEKELKKILNNYGSNIQMLGSEFDFRDYQLLKIETFFDLLEISDKLRQPILMKENIKKQGAYFIIPSNTHLLYVYRIKVSDIQKTNKKVNKDFEEKNK